MMIIAIFVLEACVVDLSRFAFGTTFVQQVRTKQGEARKTESRQGKLHGTCEQESRPRVLFHPLYWNSSEVRFDKLGGKA